MAVKKVMKSTENKSIQVKAERNLLGILLMLSQENELSLLKLFEYPLGPIPWSIATADGGMVKTSKAQLMLDTWRNNHFRLHAHLLTNACTSSMADEKLILLLTATSPTALSNLNETVEVNQELTVSVGLRPECQERTGSHSSVTQQTKYS